MDIKILIRSHFYGGFVFPSFLSLKLLHYENSAQHNFLSGINLLYCENVRRREHFCEMLAPLLCFSFQQHFSQIKHVLHNN